VRPSVAAAARLSRPDALSSRTLAPTPAGARAVQGHGVTVQMTLLDWRADVTIEYECGRDVNRRGAHCRYRRQVVEVYARVLALPLSLTALPAAFGVASPRAERLVTVWADEVVRSLGDSLGRHSQQYTLSSADDTTGSCAATRATERMSRATPDSY
jgi:hypothetical protein